MTPSDIRRLMVECIDAVRCAHELGWEKWEKAFQGRLESLKRLLASKEQVGRTNDLHRYGVI